jgi:D-glycero-alpha-D-manno-heptose-7-phosphate kinase
MTGVARGVELSTFADVPPNSGLGGSGSFAVALLLALHTLVRENVSPRRLAEDASEIEMRRLARPVGKQDPYVAAHGGVVGLTIERDLSVHVERIDVAASALERLEASLHVFHVGGARDSNAVLSSQHDALAARAASVEAMHAIKALGVETRRLLERGRVDEYGELLHAHWTEKRRVASAVTNEGIDAHYEAARTAGAIGGKVMGAGGGGFLLLHARDGERLRRAMAARGLRPLSFRFEPTGARIVGDGAVVEASDGRARETP